MAEGLMGALENFDRKILPLGLYASDDLVQGKHSKPRYQEWRGTIFLYLALQVCRREFYPYKEEPWTSCGQLQEELKWEEKNVSYFTRAWQDRANRGLGVRLSAWTHSFIS